MTPSEQAAKLPFERLDREKTHEYWLRAKAQMMPDHPPNQPVGTAKWSAIYDRAKEIYDAEEQCAKNALSFSDAQQAAYRLGQEDMRERAAVEADCGCPERAAVLAATTKAERRRACSREPCAADTARQIRSLPVEDAK